MHWILFPLVLIHFASACSDTPFRLCWFEALTDVDVIYKDFAVNLRNYDVLLANTTCASRLDYHYGCAFLIYSLTSIHLT